jgi:putative ABC transport system substrate-binding protein
MKKILVVVCVLCMIFSLAACGQSAAPAAEKTFTVGVCQLVQHPALDAATNGFVETLQAKLGDRVTITVLNGAGDQPSCAVIANQFVSDGVDLIMANATPALIAAAAATNEIPILGTSITAYGAAFDLEDWDSRTTQTNISGTSDLAPLDEQAAMVKTFCPDAKNVGILFCSAEPNSKFQVETIKPMLEAMGFNVNVYSFDDSNAVAAVTTTAVGENDVLYIPTDNTAASCAETINNIAKPAGVPIIAGESGLCSGCGIATLSIDYYALGCATAEMAVEILVNGKDVGSLPIQYSPEFTKMFNAELCEALNISVPDDFVPIE